MRSKYAKPALIEIFLLILRHAALRDFNIKYKKKQNKILRTNNIDPAGQIALFYSIPFYLLNFLSGLIQLCIWNSPYFDI
jgi:hypothetical protein